MLSSNMEEKYTFAFAFTECEWVSPQQLISVKAYSHQAKLAVKA